MKKYLDIIKFWSKKLIIDEEKYTVTEKEISNNSVEVYINVKKADMGKIIGKNGNIITNLRNLVNAISKKEKKAVKIVVKDM
ncbi:KH domain-containing protein [Caviibacter abscessus]|uniref:KH domain-containing protein n=1 Tax=Caviibacter abscessus TaxID=1766719 RepID=UPI00082D44AD|nr:KH domain-containing protein [Caviibacter abscessus]